MAITATLVFAKPNRLRYLINVTTAAVQAVRIDNSVLLADAVAGRLKQIIRQPLDGYGKLAAGGSGTQVNGRALFFSENAASVVGPGIPTAICRYTPLGTVSSACRVDSNLDGDTYPCVSVQGSVITSGYLDIEVPGQIGA